MIRASHRRPIRMPRLSLGPQDHGRQLTLDQYRRADEAPGCITELIDGVVLAAPMAIPNHEYWVQFLNNRVRDYVADHSAAKYFIATGSEVYIPDRPGPTRPRPDLAVYRDFPDPPPRTWDDISPIVVAEVISDRRAEKDTVRNRHLYWAAAAIAEYWIIDPRRSWSAPTLIALHRPARGDFWNEQVVPFGKIWRSKALPRFALNLKRA